jgi:DNA invertase Pin-like site-specific DNA recombinase
MATSRRAALYVRVSTADRGQTVENQLQPLQEAAGRLGWTVVAIYRDEGISGTRGRDKRPGLDALLKGVARREFDIVAAWSVCRLGRSLSDLIGLLGELRSRDIDLYLHQQALDTSTPSGRMLFGMLGVFSEFERAMIRDRVMAGLDRARSSGKRLGRPRTTPFQVQRIRLALDEGRGVRETARLLKVSAAKVSEVRRMSANATGKESVLRTQSLSVRNGTRKSASGRGNIGSACLRPTERAVPPASASQPALAVLC